jgi:hypothetical protein
LKWQLLQAHQVKNTWLHSPLKLFRTGSSSDISCTQDTWIGFHNFVERSGWETNPGSFGLCLFLAFLLSHSGFPRFFLQTYDNVRKTFCPIIMDKIVPQNYIET